MLIQEDVKDLGWVVSFTAIVWSRHATHSPPDQHEASVPCTCIILLRLANSIQMFLHFYASRSD